MWEARGIKGIQAKFLDKLISFRGAKMHSLLLEGVKIYWWQFWQHWSKLFVFNFPGLLCPKDRFDSTSGQISGEGVPKSGRHVLRIHWDGWGGGIPKTGVVTNSALFSWLFVKNAWSGANRWPIIWEDIVPFRSFEQNNHLVLEPLKDFFSWHSAFEGPLNSSVTILEG